MYRALGIVLLTLLPVAVGCQKKEIAPDASQKFGTQEEARKKAMATAFEKMGGGMRPEQKDAFEKMKNTSDPTAKPASGTTTPNP